MRPPNLSPEDWNEMKRFVGENLQIINAVSDLLAKHKVTSLQGEKILLWLAGGSAAVAQRSIADPGWIVPAAIAWSVGASKDPGEWEDLARKDGLL